MDKRISEALELLLIVEDETHYEDEALSDIINTLQDYVANNEDN